MDSTREDEVRRGRRAGPPSRRGNGRTGRKRKDPLWAKLLVIFGALMMLASGTVIIGQKLIFAAATSSFNQTDLLDPEVPRQHVSINGAKNILLVGIDSRPNQNPSDLIRADSIMIMHIPATHDRAYLVSIPRDTYVEVPPFSNGKTQWRGGHDKINGAFAHGGDGLVGLDARKKGFILLQQTIKKEYNIDFQAGAIVDFAGFQEVVSVLGGVWMNVDERTPSIHIGYDRNGKFKAPAWIDGSTHAHPVPGVTPKVYNPGYQHLAPWEALDYVRQREWIPDGDYGRMRHQQQFIKAVFKGILSGNVLSDPGKLSKVLDVVGKAMTIDNGHIDLEDWIFAMRNIGAGDVMTIKPNGGQFQSKDIPGFGSVETLNETSLQLLNAVRTDTVDNFALNHSDWVSQS
jgi:anionic cell wall polymer biosynthesis LytR-Cps2A-Psr (LCP) family protein